ncbi:metallophosphoesterase [Desulfatiferula olefinivorans]
MQIAKGARQEDVISIFGTILTLAVTVMHLYVFFRVNSVMTGFGVMPRLAVFAGGGVFFLLFVAGRFHLFASCPSVAGLADLIGMHWMGILFIVAFCLLIGDLSCGFGFLFLERVTVIRCLALMCGVILSGIAHVQGLRPPIIESYEVPVRHLPDHRDGFRMAVLSDLHVGEAGIGAGWLSARIDQVMAVKPDAVVLVGDLFEREAVPETMIPVMKRLGAPYGVWAVRGNHDSPRPGRPDVTLAILSGAGIPLLENRAVLAADGWVMAGVDDLTTARRRTPGRETSLLDTALNGRPPGTTVFLSHTPWLVDRAAESGVDLMISGHTHQGQIWPFTCLVRMVYPYVGGRYTIGDMTLIVCRGTGTWGPRMRLSRPGEISLIRLNRVAN